MHSSIKNIIIFGVITLFDLVAFIVALCYNQSIPLIVVGSVTTVGFITIFVAILYHHFSGQPDFITSQGTKIWAGGIDALPKVLLEDALDFYKCEIVKRFEDHKVYPIFEKDIYHLLKNLNIKWSKKPVHAIGTGWVVDQAAGLQRGDVILVYWKGTICGSALFHEINHAVDELVLKVPPDYDHGRKDWWEAVSDMKRLYANIELGQSMLQ